jgi:hypothetical protein
MQTQASWCAADYCRRMTETYLAQSPVTDPEELTSYGLTSGPQQVTLRPGLAT